MTTLVRPRTEVPGDRRIDLPGLLIGLVRGRSTDAAWVRPALIGVGLLAAVLYIWNLTVSGYANTYYSAAALAGSQSWSAWFFGSVDASNFITVDKPPLAIMLMGLSVRLFGLSSLSILLPEAILGVASVLLLFHVVRRQFGPAAALIAAVVMALSPAAVLMFRYNNPDALLTFLLIAAAAALQRALVDGRVRWLIVCAVLVGLGFNAKFLQAYLVLPAFVLTWLIAAPTTLVRRVAALVPMAVAGVVSSFWWVAIVDLIPAANRPFIGGSTDGTAFQLLFGYDGLGRIFGQGAGGAPGGGAFSGTTGLDRLFNSDFGGQISWFIPLVLVALVAGLLIHFRAPRTDLRRAAYLVWGGWFLVTAAVFSFMSGIVHSYYAVALAPAIGALVGAGLVDLWRLRSRSVLAGLVLAGGIVATAIWSAALLNRTPTFLPGADLLVVMVGFAAAVVIAMPAARQFPRLSIAAAAIAVVALLVGPAAYATDTIATAYSGGTVSAGPSADGGPGGFGGRGGFGGGAPGGPPPGGFDGAGQAPTGVDGGAGAPDGQNVASSKAMLDYLVANRGAARWIVAVSSANSAGSIELATGQPVMAMGGFSGSDPTPTLAQLQAYVASGQLRFVLLNGSGGGPGGRGGASSAVSSWVSQTCSAVTSVSTGLYDCSGAVSASQ
jgi:4-amino-4-deoxy-L-arabinose transferase-like glycosyltransferase